MNTLFLCLLFPLLGWAILAFSRGRLSENLSAMIGVGSVGLSALFAFWIIAQFNLNPPENGVFIQHLWNWISVGNFTPSITLYLDGLSLTLLGVVTGVGFLIHLFASWYMRGENGYSRFFAYTNLFIFSMLLLILGDSLPLLYFGWEGVGLCSYLLIGFYYSERKNGNAAMKAFIVTRIGDVFMAIGLFILFAQLGTLNIRELLILAPQHFAAGDFWIELACLMLLGGAVGKSAQLPLQTWLADAMAGPTPVSALIHAATMVTAGVYLIARCHGLFALAPETLHLVGMVGAATLVMAGFAALVQTDIKRILAYSTMSQLGYMFLALGVGGWSAAIFHLMTHAFFKALLFLASGSVIIACHHEQNIFKMGGLWKKLPLAYASFIVGGCALAALPLVTAGFYSKDEILWEAFASGHSGLLYAGLLGAFMTSLYTFRLIFIAFHGEMKTNAHAPKGLAHGLPLVTLLILSTFIGALISPPLASVLPQSPGHGLTAGKHALEITSGAIALAGIVLAALLFLLRRELSQKIAQSTPGRLLSAWWFAAFGFDWLYDKLFVQPYLAISHALRADPVNSGISVIPTLARRLNQAASLSQNGKLRWYAAAMTAGAIALLAVLVLLP